MPNIIQAYLSTSPCSLAPICLFHQIKRLLSKSSQEPLDIVCFQSKPILII